jgi:superfamily II DNA helicase RecQ
MTTPPKTREEWEIELSRLTDTLVRDSQWGEDFRRHLDAITSLQAIADGAQAEIARLTTQASLSAIERQSLRSDAERSRMIVANIHSMAAQTIVRVDSVLAKSILSEIEKARQPK